MDQASRALWQGRHAAHGQHHHRAVADRGYRADHRARRARAKAPAHPPRARMSNAASSAHRSELRVVGTSVTREVELLLDRLAQSVGRRAPRILQVGSRTLVSDRNERNWRGLLTKRFGSGAEFIGIDLLEGSHVDKAVDICSPPKALASALGTRPFDLVICCHVLEHTREPRRAARNIESMLGAKGLTYVATPWSEAL